MNLFCSTRLQINYSITSMLDWGLRGDLLQERNDVQRVRPASVSTAHEMALTGQILLSRAPLLRSILWSCHGAQEGSEWSIHSRSSKTARRRC